MSISINVLKWKKYGINGTCSRNSNFDTFFAIFWPFRLVFLFVYKFAEHNFFVPRVFFHALSDAIKIKFLYAWTEMKKREKHIFLAISGSYMARKNLFFSNSSSAVKNMCLLKFSDLTFNFHFSRNPPG